MLNRDQYGSRPLLYGPYFSAPPEALVEKEVTYLDEDGRYKTARIPRTTPTPRNSCTSSPACGTPTRTNGEYKQWGAYRTRTEIARDENGEAVRDEQGRPVRQEVLDFGRRRTYTDSYGDTRAVTEPTFGGEPPLLLQLPALVHVLALLPLELRGAPERHPSPRARRSPTATGSRASNGSTRSTSDRRRTCRARWPATRAATPTTSCRSCWDSSGCSTRLNRDPRNFSIVMWLFIMTGIALVFYFNTSPGRTRERDYVYAGSFYAFSIWIGFGVLALRELFARLTGRDTAATVAATAVCMAVPAILAAQNWDDHDRSGPLHGARHRLELPPVHAAQLHHHQLRRQRHLPALEQSGGLWRASRRADHEHLLSGRRMVHRRDEDPRQRRSGRALLAAQEQIHPYERLHPGI